MFKALELKVPPLIIVTLCALLMWLIAARMPAFIDHHEVRVGAVSLFLSAGTFFCAAGLSAFRRAKTTVNPVNPGAASTLVCSGIYRISRNPMYVGFALLLAAWAIYLNSFWALTLLPGFIIYITRWQILPEERALRERFGSEFARYQTRVRRWL